MRPRLRVAMFRIFPICGLNEVAEQQNKGKIKMKTLLALVGLVLVSRFAWMVIQKMNPEFFANQSFQIGYWVVVIVAGILVLGRD